MSTLSQFAGGVPVPKSINNAFSSAGFTPKSNVFQLAQSSGATLTSSGALTSNTLKNVIDITGAGCCTWLSLNSVDTTSRTMRGKITIDGVVVLDATSAASTNAGSGATFIGTGANTTAYAVSLEPIYFKTSFKFEIASSLTETDKLQYSCKYFTA